MSTYTIYVPIFRVIYLTNKFLQTLITNKQNLKWYSTT